ncbi:HlyD family secretion protein [Solitalea longa]|uniref:HlyD family secretion protein n=1 Tax=Solitalea longa TaxID=2079460 RepID=A0A2S5A5M6_9SPHI|nr:HlyD family secretion protein [Solitalea longa]POY37888.1 HlyD family secretion protein [Solitalea longa]
MEQESTPKKSTNKLVVIGIIVGLSLVIAGVMIFTGSNYESTDNAQLDGNLYSIRAGVTGFVKELRFADNQKVKKGDTLLVFDTDELSAKVLQAQAVLQNAKASLSVSKNTAFAGSKNATASQKTAESNRQATAAAKAKLNKAQLDLERVNKLLAVKGATQEQVENAQANLQIAQSEYKKAIDQEQSSLATSQGAKSQAEANTGQIGLSNAQISQREAELKVAQKQLSYAYVIAPCDGIVTKRAFNLGQYVTVGQSLCVVVDVENHWISANFKETQIKQMKIGSKVEIKLDSYADLKLTGKVESFGGATGAKFSLLPPDNATGNFIKITQRVPVRITIDNFPADKKFEIFPGLSAFVKVKVD